jgi:hypothetical protein
LPDRADRCVCPTWAIVYSACLKRSGLLFDCLCSAHLLRPLDHLLPVRSFFTPSLLASCSVGITKLIYQYCEFLGEIFRNSLFNGITLLLTGNEEKLLSLLTPLNVNCHASDGRKSTPLHLASGYNRTRIVQLLLQHGADVHAKVGGGYITLLWSIYRSKTIPPPPPPT